ncbi:MAG: 16S rRNA (cytidine(1402)-2'-O)-methyltransferase [Xanthomonadales bacterium]|nr:16S rRNA (cytidine(1402)-2'-O)-methyltransferase [Gammaproteobacteria bacterium]MBT8052597.1 16S rRNA (cytidine(1402)-2'-O)-methyltransferase [Gammaproteobacteria bacterium]NND56644.1 16S rRNA (cytidine(1402)-2'-O)-methyltransferase [Xanthomonadales bacterium]NNK52414.1 16S rRNA (cytidine(1402)-2'-O)-methyltransferase [Xanthomonadales bacterium]
MNEARLYVVATPIGNLQDITLRALQVLAAVDVIAAEDTRHTRVLMSRHGLDRPLVSLQEHNEERRAPQLVERLLGGESVALVSDAGTPLLSDPGFRFVRLAADAGIEIVAVPGASAITAALSISGLATDRFAFEGFLPQRAAARLKRLSELKQESRTLVFFESSHRIQQSLADLSGVFGRDRQIAVCREMTKQFETVLRGPLPAVIERIEQDPNQRKGEFVLVVAGCDPAGDESFAEALRLAQALLAYLPASQAARAAANLHGVSRRDVYKALEQADAAKAGE